MVSDSIVEDHQVGRALRVGELDGVRLSDELGQTPVHEPEVELVFEVGVGEAGPEAVLDRGGLRNGRRAKRGVSEDHDPWLGALRGVQDPVVVLGLVKVPEVGVPQVLLVDEEFFCSVVELHVRAEADVVHLLAVPLNVALA